MFKVIGSYFGREVLYKSTSLYEKQLIPELSTSVVLVRFDDATIDDKQFELFLNHIIQAELLSITLCGINTDKYFGKLLEMLSVMSDKKHIMTYISKPENCLDDFFLASWPAEERHDDWQNYIVIEVGGSDLEQALKNYLQK
jgi:hypothetical protein